jgi:hypothetical protein
MTGKKLSAVGALYISITLAGCLSMVGDDVKIADKTLKDGSIIQLTYRGGGATAPDVIWVSRKRKNDPILISKFKWFENGYTTDIEQITDDTINIKFTDTSVFKSHVTNFKISLRDTIHFNDDSPFAIPQKNSN